MEDLDHCDWEPILQELIQGRDAAAELQGSLFGLHENEDGTPTAAQEDLARTVAGSFGKSLSMLGYGDPLKSDGTGTAGLPVPKPVVGGKIDGRGRYKRWKTCDFESKITPTLVGDGYVWRKYGEKMIQGSNFPRSYFRCTHKSDQSCKAVKQVQQISEDPPSYRTTCYGHHTCNNASFSQQFAIPDEKKELNLISFDGTADRNMTDDGLFPSAVFSNYFEDNPVGLMGGGSWANMEHGSTSNLGFAEEKEGKLG